MAPPFQVDLHEVDDGPIFHYLGLPKLLRLLTSSTMFFPKLDAHRKSDPYECALWPNARYKNESLEDLRNWAQVLAAVRPTSLPGGSIDDRVNKRKLVREEIEKANIQAVREVIETSLNGVMASSVIVGIWITVNLMQCGSCTPREREQRFRVLSGNWLHP